jgi:hypothetical protein
MSITGLLAPHIAAGRLQRECLRVLRQMEAAGARPANQTSNKVHLLLAQAGRVPRWPVTVPGVAART